MSVPSLEFFFLILLVSAFFFQIPTAGARRLVFAACSVGFLSTYIPNPRSWFVLFGFLLSGYGCAQLLRVRPSRIIFTTYLVLLIATFAVLKKYVFLELFAPARTLDLGVEIVGVSYMLFRQIHFLVDSMQGQIECPTLWSYLNFQLNPLTLLAGPIQRYQDFQEYWQDPVPLPADRHEILKAYLRLFVGVIKVVVLSKVFHDGYESFLGRLGKGDSIAASGGWRAVGYLIVMLYLLTIHIYMNFSGYCDIVIATARLIGLRLPENFDKPFLARNILDLWTRWHITLGIWIRDYLFAPFYKAGAERFPRHTRAVGIAGYLVAFTVAGIWHGSTWNFLIYGLMHGAGASAAKLWENTIVWYGGRQALRKYLKSPVIRLVATFATFHYLCLTVLFFELDVDRALKILLGVVGSFTRGY
jgi:alginate O-acetyltransferase complex protein AlgI